MLLRCFRVAIGHGTTYHIYLRRKWFSNLEKLDSGVVIMGMMLHVRCLGYTSVRFKMFDGVIRDLTDVRYIPQMKKNIISAGVVESKSLKVALENGIIKVIKGSML